MFDRAVIARKEEACNHRYRGELGSAGLVRYTVGQCQDWRTRLEPARDAKGAYTRALTKDEERFMLNEWLLCKIDVEYYLERYATINIEGSGLGTIYPLWESQRFILDRMAAIERSWDGDPFADGVLVHVLKARQLGASSLSQALLAHRLTTHTNTFGLVASDVPESSAFLFDMFERIVEHQPWYVRPDVMEHVKNGEMLFETASHLWVGSGKSTRGTEGKRGQLGRGKTLSALHLSELSTWEDYAQIDGALMPAVPVSPRTLMIKESTAKGRQNGWHQDWLAARSGKSRFRNIFVPWYVEPSKYSMTPPAGWIPSDTTQIHAARCEAQGPRYLGHAVTLARPQIYWYEIKRSEYEAKNDLGTFLEEYAADDDECFVYSGKSVFSLAVQQRVREQMKPLSGVILIQPHRDLVEPGLVRQVVDA